MTDPPNHPVRDIYFEGVANSTVRVDARIVATVDATGHATFELRVIAPEKMPLSVRADLLRMAASNVETADD